jgi:methyl-accepting chemotaxis protein
MLQNFRLGLRLGLGFFSVVLVFIVASVALFLRLSEIEGNSHIINDTNIPKTVVADKLRGEMYEMRLSFFRLTSQHNEQNIQALLQHRAALMSSIDEFEKLLKLRTHDKEVQFLDALRKNISSIIPLQDRLINSGETDQEAIARFAGAAIENVRDLMAFENDRNKFRATEILSGSSKAAVTLIVATFIAAVLALGAAVLVTRSVTGPIARIVETVGAMAGGDLSRTIKAEGKDEIGTLQAELGRMSGNLARMIGEIRDAAKQLVASTADLSGAASNVQKGSDLQSDAASAMAAALEEMSTSISHVSTLSEDARQSSTEAGHSAHSGSGTIHAMVDEIRQVADAIRDGAVKAQQLGKESERISTIIHVIRDVADQTNLLALNAAIEAARAGEQGRGFAVVADEVRKLAEKTTASAQEITEMVGSIQSGSGAMSAQMEMTAKRMQDGMELAQKAGGAIGEIDTSAQNVVQMIDEVSSALKEQAAASHDIAGRVEQIVQMAEENSGAVTSTSAIVNQLNALAGALSGNVQRFKIPAGG